MDRFVRLGAILLFAATGSVSAQLAPIGAPKGTLRVDFRGSFESADQRIFGGRTEDYLADFGSPALGSDRIPLLRSADSLLSAILGQPGSRLNLGGMRANGQLTIGTGTIGGALGITSKLTLFGDIPLVTSRVQAHFRLDSTAGNAGLNTALVGHADNGTAVAFFSLFDNALTTLDSRIANGSYSGAQLSLAQSISARGAALRDQLEALTIIPGTAAPVLPSQGSAAGQQIIAGIRGLQDTLANSLSVPGFAVDPFLPAGRLTDADFATAIGDPLGPIAAFPLAESKIARMGDMDVGAIYTVVDRFDRPGETGGFRLALSGLLRLPTGLRDNPNNLLDVGTGNGRYEAGLSGTADLGAGAWGARFTGGYLVRFAALRVRRLAAPSEAYPDASRLTNLRYNAGDILSIGAQPYLRLARSLALHGEIDYQRVGADRTRYDMPGDSLPGLDANIFSMGRRSALAAGIGISYVGRAAHECETGRRCGWPIDASWNYTTVVHGSGDRVSKFRTTRLEIRWYQRLWR